jgi:hypothetical protein
LIGTFLLKRPIVLGFSRCKVQADYASVHRSLRLHNPPGCIEVDQNQQKSAMIDEILVALTEFKKEKTKISGKEGQWEFGRHRNRPSAAQFGRCAHPGKLRRDVNDPGLMLCAQYFGCIKTEHGHVRAGCKNKKARVRLKRAPLGDRRACR